MDGIPSSQLLVIGLKAICIYKCPASASGTDIPNRVDYRFADFQVAAFPILCKIPCNEGQIRTLKDGFYIVYQSEQIVVMSFIGDVGSRIIFTLMPKQGYQPVAFIQL